MSKEKRRCVAIRRKIALCFILIFLGFFYCAEGRYADGRYTNEEIVSAAREEFGIFPVENTTAGVVYRAYLCIGEGKNSIEKPNNMDQVVSIFLEKDIPTLYQWEEEIFIESQNKYILASRLSRTNMSMIYQVWESDYTIKSAYAFGPGNKIYELDPVTGEPEKIITPLNCPDF